MRDRTGFNISRKHFNHKAHCDLPRSFQAMYAGFLVVYSGRMRGSRQKLQEFLYQHEEELHCQSDEAPEQPEQIGCGVSFSADIQDLSVHLPVCPAVGNCFSRGLDSLVSWSPFQPLQFCGYSLLVIVWKHWRLGCSLLFRASLCCLRTGLICYCTSTSWWCFVT